MCILDLSLLLIICTCICSEIAHVDVMLLSSSLLLSLFFFDLFVFVLFCFRRPVLMSEGPNAFLVAF